MLGVTSVAIVVGVVYTSIPEDPEVIYQQALQQLERYDSLNMEELPPTVERLKAFPEYADHVLYLEGRMCAVQRRDIRALELYEEATRNEELKPILKVAIGDSLGRTGKFHEAIAAYEEAVQLEPDSANDTRLKLARLYFTLGAAGLAEKTLETVCETEPKNREARTILARICSDVLRFDDSLAHMKALLQNEGDFSAASPDFLRAYTVACLEVGDQEALQELSDKHTGVLTNDEIKAKLKIAVGALDEIRTAYGGAVEEGLAKPEAELGYGLVLVADGDPAAALPMVEKSLRRMPRSLAAWELAVKYYSAVEDAEKLAVAEENVKQLKEMQTELVEAQLAIADEIENVEGRVRVLKALIRLQQFETARGWFNLVKQMDPDYDLRDPSTIESARGPLVPFGDAGSTEEPATEEPAKEEPAKEEPAKEEPAKEEPAKEEPAKEEPAKEEPATEEPAGDGDN